MMFWKKIQWPWTRQFKNIKEDIGTLKFDQDIIKRELERKRVAKFIQVIDYVKGMSLKDERPDPILLEDLDKRIKELEKV